MSVTFSADQYLLNKARRIAAAEHKTLNEVFRDWLDEYTSRPAEVVPFDAKRGSLHVIHSGENIARAANE